MGFKIQGSGTILKKLTQWVITSTDKITDFNVGSATRTLLESVALQIEEFYYDLKRAVEYAIRNACYHAFGFERYKASPATGKVAVYFDKPLNKDRIFDKGTQFHTGQNRPERIYFRSNERIVARAGADKIVIPVECTQEGTVGNVRVGDVTKIAVGSPNIKRVVNEEDFTNGRNMESLTDRSVRFREYITSLQRGTVDAIAYGIKQVPGVAGVSIDDSYYGMVYAYVHDRNGNLSEDLKADVMRKVMEYRSAGIEVSIKPIVKVTVNLEIAIYYREGIDPNAYDEHLQIAITNYLNSLAASESLRLSNLITAINDTYRDVINYINVKNSRDVQIAKNEIIRAGTIRIN